MTIRKLFPLVAVAVIAVSQGCLDEDPARPPGARDAETGEAVSAPEGDLGESSLMMDLAREIPGFAGVFFEPGGDPPCGFDD